MYFKNLFLRRCCSPKNLLHLLPAADAINNAAGFGFNGYNKDGSPRWDLISNLRILDIEVKRLFFFFNLNKTNFITI